MDIHDPIRICVHAGWLGWPNAAIHLEDLRDPHWFQPFGAPRELVHGYVSCDRILSGEIPHDCNPVSVPHQLHVCVLRRHVTQEAFDELARRANAKRMPGPGLAEC